MGVANSKDLKGSVKHQPKKIDQKDQQDSVYEQIIEERSFCGVKRRKTTKRKMNWQKNFIQNCGLIKNEFLWVGDLVEIVENRKISKNIYYREVLSLKNIEPISQSETETQILKSTAEIQNFKCNLKKSVLLSFRQTSRIHQEPSDHLKSIINPTASRVQKIQKNAFPIKQKANQDKFSLKSFMNKSITSYVDDTLTSVFGNQNEVSKQTAQELEVFLKFSMILEKHYNDSKCVLSKIKQAFIQFLERKYNDYQKAEQFMNQFLNDIKKFLDLLCETTLDYYNLYAFKEGEPGSNQLISNRQNVLSVCTTILFKDSQFYKLIFGATISYNHKREIAFAKIKQYIKNYPPEKFLIKDKFCLNQRTIKNYLNHMSLESGSNVIQNIQINDITVQNNQPYKNCMINLSNLSRSKTPVNKMKAIMSCSEKITRQIQKFYDLNGLKKQKWLLDADQVLAIMSYIIVGAQVQHLHSHLFILDHFSTGHQMISITGYYLSVMNCAIEQLENDYSQEVE